MLGDAGPAHMESVEGLLQHQLAQPALHHHESGGPVTSHPPPVLFGLPCKSLPSPTSLAHLPSNKWVSQHAPLLNQLEAGQPLLTPTGRHATLSLRGRFVGREGEALVEEEEVPYSLPPMAGESESADARRQKRHRTREEAAIFRLQDEAKNPGQKAAKEHKAAFMLRQHLLHKQTEKKLLLFLHGRRQV